MLFRFQFLQNDVNVKIVALNMFTLSIVISYRFERNSMSKENIWRNESINGSHSTYQSRRYFPQVSD